MEISYAQPIKWGIFCLLANLLIFNPSVYARRIKEVRYPLEIVEVVGTEIKSIQIDSQYSFSFPVSFSLHHVSAYLWLKSMIEKGSLPKGLTLVYLDAHSDYWGHRDTPQSANWVRFVLGEGLCSRARLLFPNWAIKEREIFREFAFLSKEKTVFPDLSDIDSLNDLPYGETIVLSIDCDWFSCYDPFHTASGEEIVGKVEEIVKVLREKNIRIAALNIALSPGYTTMDKEVFIRDTLLKAFWGYR
ncbi:MAG: hypothetical protein NC818_05625 [Candidatus Omnitrophica bacterium]|nr:hypothetical protein [Candidatus Omnitrophota bacterium]